MRIEISLLIGMVSMAIALLTSIASARQSARKNGIADGEQRATLNHIRGKVDEIYTQQHVISDRLDAFDHRLTVIEESAKSAHKRIDRIEKER